MDDLSHNIVIEFAGMPKSGKTTIMDLVSQHLRRSGHIVDEFHGGGRYAPVDKTDLGILNLHLAATIGVRLSSFGYPSGIDKRMYLLDRGPTDRLIFTRALVSLNRVSSEHFAAVESFFKAPEYSGVVNHTFVFVTSVDLSLQRENKFSLSDQQGRVMNTAMLDALYASAHIESESDRPFTQRVELVDTAKSNNEVRETARRLVAVIEELIHERSLPQ